IKNKLKIILIILFILTAVFLVAIVAVGALELTPPELPVLYYGTASINNQPVTTSPVITARRKTDGLEIASATASPNGKYFIEMPCSDYVGQTIIFRIGNLITRETSCVDVATVPSVNLDLKFNSINQTIDSAISNIDIPSSVSDSTEVKITFIATSTTADGHTTATTGADGLILTRKSLTPANNFVVTFPANTVITGDSSWDGTLIAPTLSNISLNIPAAPGFTGQADETINIGFTGQTLTFDKPVSILFPGQAGRQIGFSVDGTNFIEITNRCPANNGASLTATTTECKFNGPVDDLTVWTKHFTYFAVYTQSPVPPPSRETGGFLYGFDWLAQATTTVATTTEDNQAPATPIIEPVAEPIIEPKIPPQILGVKYYANGSLIRGQDKKIYLISDDKLVVIRNPEQLKKYAGRIIYDVADEVIRQYMDFTDGQLIRGADKKIYVIISGRKKLIQNLQELKQYGGQKIYNVSLEILAKFPQYLIKPGVEYFIDGSLIRGQDGKIYLIQNNKLVVIRTLTELQKYKGQKIYDVPDPVIRQYLEFFDGQLIRGSMKKIYVITNGKKQPIFTLAELKKYAGQKIYDVSDKILGLY
ncbi:MAG: hypothetical protein ABIB72_00925, partial [Candidatus Falkowbacteria bacterium]